MGDRGRGTYTIYGGGGRGRGGKGSSYSSLWKDKWPKSIVTSTFLQHNKFCTHIIENKRRFRAVTIWRRITRPFRPRFKQWNLQQTHRHRLHQTFKPWHRSYDPNRINRTSDWHFSAQPQGTITWMTRNHPHRPSTATTINRSFWRGILERPPQYAHRLCWYYHDSNVRPPLRKLRHHHSRGHWR